MKAIKKMIFAVSVIVALSLNAAAANIQWQGQDKRPEKVKEQPKDKGKDERRDDRRDDRRDEKNNDPPRKKPE